MSLTLIFLQPLLNFHLSVIPLNVLVLVWPSCMLLWRTLKPWVVLPHVLVSTGCCFAVSVCAGSQASFKGGCPSSYFALPSLPALHLPSSREKNVSEITQKYYLYSKLIFFSFVLTLRALYFFLKYVAFNFMCLSLLWCFHLDIAKNLLLFRTSYSNSLL